MNLVRAVRRCCSGVRVDAVAAGADRPHPHRACLRRHRAAGHARDRHPRADMVRRRHRISADDRVPDAVAKLSDERPVNLNERIGVRATPA